MENKLALRPKVVIPTPVLAVINASLAELIQKDLDELAVDLNKCIELGIKDDRLAREANAVVEDAILAEKTVKEIRLSFTRPIDQGKKTFMEEVEKMLSPVVKAKNKLDGQLMDRTAKIKAKAARIKREAEEAQAAADKVARDREEHNRNISIGKGGTGEVAKVEAEIIAQPVDLTSTRSVVKTSSIVDKDKIEAAVTKGVRKIPGVKIFQIWVHVVEDHKKVPEEYRKLRR